MGKFKMRKPNPKGIKSPLEHDGKTTGGHDYLLKHGDRQVELHYQKDDHSQYDDGYGNDGPPDGTFLRDKVESSSNSNDGEELETKTLSTDGKGVVGGNTPISTNPWINTYNLVTKVVPDLKDKFEKYNKSGEHT